MNQLNVSLQHSIITLAAKGWSARKIARELGVHRETVGRYLQPVVPESKPAIAPTGSEAAPAAKPANVPAGSKPGRTSQCAPLSATPSSMVMPFAAQSALSLSNAATQNSVCNVSNATPMVFTAPVAAGVDAPAAVPGESDLPQPDENSETARHANTANRCPIGELLKGDFINEGIKNSQLGRSTKFRERRALLGSKGGRISPSRAMLDAPGWE